MGDAYAAFAQALQDGGIPRRRPAFIANTIAIGCLFAASTSLFGALAQQTRPLTRAAYSLIASWVRGTLWIVARRDGRLRVHAEYGPVFVAAVFGVVWTTLCIVWTVEAEREAAVVGSMALLIICFSMGTFLLSALLLATDSFLPRDRSSRVLRKAALVVYVLQPLTVRPRCAVLLTVQATACIVAAVFIELDCERAYAMLIDVLGRLGAFQAAGRPFDEAQAAIGPALADMGVVGARIARWSQGILAVSTALGCLWLAIFAPMSVLLFRQYDRRYQALSRGVRAAQTLERRGEFAVAPGGMVSAHLSSGMVDSGSRPFKGLASHRQVVRNEQLADLERITTARRWIVVKNLTVLAVAVSFCVSACACPAACCADNAGWLCVRSPQLSVSELRLYAMLLFGWPYGILALIAAGLSAYDARQAGAATDRAVRNLSTVQVDHVRIAVAVPPLPLDVGQGVDDQLTLDLSDHGELLRDSLSFKSSPTINGSQATFDSASPLAASWRPSDWSGDRGVPEIIVTEDL